MPVDNRAAPEGILRVLRNDVPCWELPTSLFGMSGVTCWRRLRDWREAGIWQRLHEASPTECHTAGLLDLHRTLVRSSHVHALKADRQVRTRSTAAVPTAPCDHGCYRGAASRDRYRWQPARRHPVDPAGAYHLVHEPAVRERGPAGPGRQSAAG
ncbi:transposase [Protofrankia symbiont of Coriaria ruscifolia]|uniref:transposase n=1 Tax=Protofrankia symbiont of Coriaria ruscifolia TaxID=1306542 RepID=UPI003D6C8EBF